MKMNLFPKKKKEKTFLLHFSPGTKGTTDQHISNSLVNTAGSVDEDKVGDHSVMLIKLE